METARETRGNHQPGHPLTGADDNPGADVRLDSEPRMVAGPPGLVGALDHDPQAGATSGRAGPMTSSASRYGTSRTPRPSDAAAAHAKLIASIHSDQEAPAVSHLAQCLSACLGFEVACLNDLEQG